MAAISSIIAATALAATAVGVGTSVYGASKQSEAQGNVAAGQAEQARIQQINTRFQQMGLGITQQQQQLQISTQRQAIQLQQQQDDVRRQAAKLDATRRTREMVRQSILANSQALTLASNQGANASGSSALGGARGTISGRTGTNILGVTQALQSGESIFDLNKAISTNYLSAQDKNSDLVGQSGGIQNAILGLQEAANAQGINIALNYKDAASAGTISAFGSGLTSLGGAMVKNQETMTNLVNYFQGTFGNSNADSSFNGVGSAPY